MTTSQRGFGGGEPSFITARQIDHRPVASPKAGDVAQSTQRHDPRLSALCQSGAASLAKPDSLQTMLGRPASEAISRAQPAAASGTGASQETRPQLGPNNRAYEREMLHASCNRLRHFRNTSPNKASCVLFFTIEPRFWAQIPVQILAVHSHRNWNGFSVFLRSRYRA